MAIFNFLIKYTGSREIAQELIQDTFTRIWLAANTFKPGRGNFRSWLYTIALNLARDEMSKKQYTYRFYGPQDIYNDEKFEKDLKTPDPQTALEQKEIWDSVLNALSQLKPHLREVIIMKNYQHLKFREIAQVTQVPEGTLKARYHRAILVLKEILCPEEVNSHVKNV